MSDENINGEILFENLSQDLGHESDTFFINKKEVTKEEYDKEYDKYEPKNWVEVGRKYILDESGINEAFGS